MPQRRLTVALETGLHARPAAQFVQTAAASDASVTIAKDGGAGVDAKSMLSVLGLGAAQGDQILLDSTDKAVLDRLEALVTGA